MMRTCRGLAFFEPRISAHLTYLPGEAQEPCCIQPSVLLCCEAAARSFAAYRCIVYRF
jgi:hypothetical protein